MFCTQCGSQLGEKDRFCSQCAHPTAINTPPRPTRRTLALDKRNGKLAAVCAGFARYMDVDVTLMRILWIAVTIFTGGLGFFAYLAAWIIMPKDEYARIPATEYVQQT